MHQYDICKTLFGASWLGIFRRGFFALLLIPRVSDASGSETTLEHLEGLLNSHTQSLMKINTYLVKIDQLYYWYSKNHRHIDELLAKRTTSSGGNQLDHLQQMAERMNFLEDKIINSTTFQGYNDTKGLLTIASIDARLSNLEEKERRRDEQIASLSTKLNTTDAVENLVMFNRQMASKCNKSIEEMYDSMGRFTDRFEKIDTFLANLTSVSDEFKNKTANDQSDLAAKVAAIESFRNVSLESNIYLDENVQSLQQNVRALYNRTNGYGNVEEELNRLKKELETFNRSGRSAGTVTPELEALLYSKFQEIHDRINASVTAQASMNLQAAELRLKEELQKHFESEQIQNMKVEFRNIQDQVKNLLQRTTSADSATTALQEQFRQLSNSVPKEDDMVHIKTQLQRLESDIRSLKTQQPAVSDGVTSASVAQLSARLGELERKVGQKNSVRERGDELLSRLTGGQGTNADRELPEPWRLNSVG